MHDDPTDWHEFLSQLVQSLHARGGGVWLTDGQHLRLAATAGISPAELIVSDEARQQRRERIEQCLRTRQAGVFELDVPDTAAEIGPVTLYLIALFDADRLLGLVEIVQRPRLSQQLLLGQLQFLEQSCGRPVSESAPSPRVPLSDPLTKTEGDPPESNGVFRDQIRSLSAAGVDWPAIVTCLRHIQQTRRLREVAEAIANETRLVFDADRVSVGIPAGRDLRIAAVSGQDRVQRRSNVIKAMERLAQLIMATKEPFCFDGTAENIPPSLEQPLSQFTQLSGARLVLIVPLLTARNSHAAATEPESPARDSTERTEQGVLIIEKFRQSQPQPRLVAHLELLQEPLATLISHARAYEAIFLLPLWIALGGWWKSLRGRKRVWYLAIGSVLLIMIAAMVWIPWNYRVESQGQLMPVVQRDMFAPWDGQVTELLVRGGDRVSEGQPLVRLRNDELAAELVKTRGELGEKRKLVVALYAQLDDAERNAQRDEETRLRGKVAETQIEVEGLAERLKILTDRIERLTVRAPITGVITTFQAEQLLVNRPVQRGDVLLQVMDDHGDWQLELDVAEQRLGHILAARKNSAGSLPVTFRLLTRPEAAYEATLSSLGTRSVTSEQRGSVVELRATLDVAGIEQPSIGAQVRARIDCGSKPLGYCLFGDVIEFVQKYLWW